MLKGIQAIRGMHDTLPEDTPYWQLLENTVCNVMAAYGYTEIRMPMLEKTELFKRSIGEVTDIVEKEMYTFEDRNGDSLSLRPEGTAGCVRAALEHGLLHNQTQRLWYSGAMFRHERPQKGRYRQFYQIGVETFGMSGPDIDAEVILMTRRLWDQLGLAPYVSLQINTLGTPEARHAYRDKLVSFLEQHRDELDEDSQRRLNSNPLRVLDSKDPKTREVVADAPQLVEHLDAESRQHFELLQRFLETAGVSFTVNPHLVRGLDYYSRTVFEWVTDRLGAQGTVCAGGRYDGLVEMLGGKPTPAVGFAMGVERLVTLIRELETREPFIGSDCYMVLAGDNAQLAGLKLAEFLRGSVANLSLLVNCGGGSFKAQMKRADKSGARWALILGDSEVERNVVGVKPLRSNEEQQTLNHEDLVNFLKSSLVKP